MMNRKFQIWLKCESLVGTRIDMIDRMTFAEAASEAYGLVHDMLQKTGKNWRVDQIKDIGKVEDE
jgi:hypothetical protein